MNKTLLASMAALLVTTAPICADTETYSNTTVTAYQDYDATNVTVTTRSKIYNSLYDTHNKIIKTVSALYALTGTGIMATAYKRYEGSLAFPQPNLDALSQQYNAMQEAILGAACTVGGILAYHFTSKAEQNTSN